MEVFSVEDYSPKPTCAAVGSFDGLHLAHMHILRTCISSPLRSMVVTFRTHPVREKDLLFTPEEKLRALEDAGVDAVLLLEKEHKSITASQFIDLLITHFDVRCLLMGYDHRFGRGREGSASWLIENIQKYPLELHLFPPVVLDGEIVSSTLIRRLIKEGKVERAARFLGRNYTVSGYVVQGKGIGKKIGFPTANLEVPPYKLLPADGVYAVYLPQVLRWGAMHIGQRPTLGLERSVEVHILDFTGNVPSPLSVELVTRIRGVKKFTSLHELKEAIKADLEKVRKVIASYIRLRNEAAS